MVTVGNECWSWDKDLPRKTCKKIIKLGKGKWEQAKTFRSHPADDIRKSDIVWVNDQWVYDLIWKYMLTANEQAGWKYNIVAAENCQVTRYTKDGFYTWHIDGLGSHIEKFDRPDSEFLHNNTRKLSMSIILNSDFEGGDFEIFGLKDNDTFIDFNSKKEGSIIVFPSFSIHRVAPVTKGVRYSLVAWFLGPPFV